MAADSNHVGGRQFYENRSTVSSFLSTKSWLPAASQECALAFAHDAVDCESDAGAEVVDACMREFLALAVDIDLLPDFRSSPSMIRKSPVSEQSAPFRAHVVVGNDQTAVEPFAKIAVTFD